MYILLKHVRPLGLKGAVMYSDAQFHEHFYRVDAARRRVVAIGNLTPQTVCVFTLAQSDFTAFKKGRLSLVPPGCCCATGHRHKYADKIVFRGDIKSKKHLAEILGTA